MAKYIQISPNWLYKGNKYHTPLKTEDSHDLNLVVGGGTRGYCDNLRCRNDDEIGSMTTHGFSVTP